MGIIESGPEPSRLLYGIECKHWAVQTLLAWRYHKGLYRYVSPFGPVLWTGKWGYYYLYCNWLKFIKCRKIFFTRTMEVQGKVWLFRKQLLDVDVLWQRHSWEKGEGGNYSETSVYYPSSHISCVMKVTSQYFHANDCIWLFCLGCLRDLLLYLKPHTQQTGFTPKINRYQSKALHP